MYTEKKEAQNFSAFPCAAFGPAGDDIHQRGMSMRDWFAGMALQGFTSFHGARNYTSGSIDEYAEEAFSLADAMMKARIQNGNIS